MSHEFIILLITAATLGFTHTLLGPDHYLPFILISKEKRWTPAKTSFFTFVCGLGHVGSSVLIGYLGLTFGVELYKLKYLESFRGNIAGWMLIAFGLMYLIWGLRKAWKNRPHKHEHIHEDGQHHVHVHTHVKSHSHFHFGDLKEVSPWYLFIILIFGPCEVLIPLVMYPAAQASAYTMMLLVGTFSLATIGTMVMAVALGTYGYQFLRFKFLENHAGIVAGFSIMLCGVAIQFLGL